MVAQILFAAFAAVAVVSALRVVLAKDAARAAFALVLSLGVLGPLFLLLRAEFSAVVQLIVYVGAVVVLFVFVIMLTSNPEDPQDAQVSSSVKGVAPAVLAAIGLFAVVSFAALDTFGESQIGNTQPGDLVVLGRDLLTKQLFAFEVMSVLLLAALIGALAMARRN